MAVQQTRKEISLIKFKLKIFVLKIEQALRYIKFKIVDLTIGFMIILMNIVMKILNIIMRLMKRDDNSREL